MTRRSEAEADPAPSTSAADFLAHAGVPTLIDSEHAIAHNKVMVVDGETVITGAFNFFWRSPRGGKNVQAAIRRLARAERLRAEEVR